VLRATFPGIRDSVRVLLEVRMDRLALKFHFPVIVSSTVQFSTSHPDIPCFLLLDDPADELLLSAGLGTDRILAMPLALHAMPSLTMCVIAQSNLPDFSSIKVLASGLLSNKSRRLQCRRHLS
jgi:hypothetical protein